MSLHALLSIAVAVVLAENFVLTQFLGVRPLLDGGKKLPAAACMGGAVTGMMVLSSLFVWVLNALVLTPLHAAFLRPAAFLLLIAGLALLLEWASARWLPALRTALDLHLPVVTANSALLGAALLQTQYEYTFLQSLAFSALSGVGFTLAAVLLAGLTERLESADIPKPFQGIPIALITAGLMALAFMGFSGLRLG